MWTDRDIIKATKARYNGPAIESKAFSIDTRTLQPGDIFMALEGDNGSGKDYIKEAFDKGAIAAISTQIKDIGEDEKKLFFVEDTLQALHQLAKFQRSRLKQAKIIGVTGSAGKTTTKEMLRLILKPFGKVWANIKSYNNHWGAPLTMINCPLDTQYAIFELGMNHAGELLSLTKLVEPDIAVVTTVGAAHTEFFDSVDDVAKAKGEIFAGVPKDGIAIVNGDIETTDILKTSAQHINKIYTFGEKAGNNFELLRIHLHQPTCEIKARFGASDKLTYLLGTVGRHFALNSVAALSVVRVLNLPMSQAAEQLSNFEAVSERGTIKELAWKGGKVWIYDESYNANPLSVCASLERFHDMALGERKVFILGEMKELGEDSAFYHQALAANVCQAAVDKFFGCGLQTKQLIEKLPIDMQAGYSDTVEELVPQVLSEVKPGDALLIKGSLSMRMRAMVQALYRHCEHSDSKPQAKEEPHAL